MTEDRLQEVAREMVLSATRKVTGMISEDADTRVVTTEAMLTEFLEAFRCVAAEVRKTERERAAGLVMSMREDELVAAAIRGSETTPDKEIP